MSNAREADCPGVQQLAMPCKVRLPDSKCLERAQWSRLLKVLGMGLFTGETPQIEVTV